MRYSLKAVYGFGVTIFQAVYLGYSIAQVEGTQAVARGYSFYLLIFVLVRLTAVPLFHQESPAPPFSGTCVASPAANGNTGTFKVTGTSEWVVSAVIG